MYGWGQEFGVFFDLCEKVFFLLQCRGVKKNLANWEPEPN